MSGSMASNRSRAALAAASAAMMRPGDGGGATSVRRRAAVVVDMVVVFLCQVTGKVPRNTIFAVYTILCQYPVVLRLGRDPASRQKQKRPGVSRAFSNGILSGSDQSSSSV